MSSLPVAPSNWPKTEVPSTAEANLKALVLFVAGSNPALAFLI
jgi:hypothetical protein